MVKVEKKSSPRYIGRLCYFSGNAFVACGVFYGIGTVHFPYSHVLLAYDLLSDQHYNSTHGGNFH